jgi:hypothetical protein
MGLVKIKPRGLVGELGTRLERATSSLNFLAFGLIFNGLCLILKPRSSLHFGYRVSLKTALHLHTYIFYVLFSKHW